MGDCRTCKHWDPFFDRDEGPGLYGDCLFFDQNRDTPFGGVTHLDWQRMLGPKEDCGVRFITLNTFGCKAWEQVPAAQLAKERTG